MELQTIGQVTKNYGISVRTLRYYEQIGLISSQRNNGNAYRFYDETAVKRLNIIILLRKLRISLKHIGEILSNQDASAAVEIFEQNITALDEEITSLSAVKSILSRFAEELRTKTGVMIPFDLLTDKTAVSVIDSLSFSKNHINSVKENLSMEDLNKANETLTKLRDKDVRIVYLPPATVAAAHVIGGLPELETGDMIHDFIKNSNLAEIKKDFRHYGFNSPNGTNNGGPSDDHGYERWVTIPDDMEVPPPLTKKRFEGGLYAAHMIPMGAFEEWGWLWEWAENSGKYDFNPGDPACMDGLIEEHLNYINNYMLPPEELDRVLQLDLLIPIKEK
jgi:DNA-binding transcriptional MerR regulator/DNA gyrase inhibitor GyrI